MFNRLKVSGILVAAAGFLAAPVWVDAASDLKAVVDRSTKAMGVENLRTLV
jgi:hypothetical protein